VIITKLDKNKLKSFTMRNIRKVQNIIQRSVVHNLIKSTLSKCEKSSYNKLTK